MRFAILALLGILSLPCGAQFAGSTEPGELIKQRSSKLREHSEFYLASKAKKKKKKKKLKKICKLFASESVTGDSDGDGIGDKDEMKVTKSDPYLDDTDGDGLLDGEELCQTKTNMLDPDSDDDGHPDGDPGGPGDPGEDPDTDPQEETPTPTPDPNSSPIPLPEGAPPPWINCDELGNTIQFGIPRGILGNVVAGYWEYQENCTSCHRDERGKGWRYPPLRSFISGPPANMGSLSEQEVANITAYLNRSRCENGGPSLPIIPPTPFPDTPEGRGEQYFLQTCSCHSSPFAGLTRDRFDQAVATVPQMNSFASADEDEFVDLFAYFESLR